MKEFVCDFHVHTCLSPCAELEMSPKAVVEACLNKGIDMIAITDHNSCENIASVMECARGTSLKALAGMEITTVEEVHIVAIFGDLTKMASLQDKIYANLPGKNDEDVFGMQVIVNASNELEGFNERLLIGATLLSLDETIAMIKNLGGLAIAAHIDREAFSLISQLGFIDPAMPFDALELACLSRQEARGSIDGCASFALIHSSDAHRLKDIGKRTTRLLLKEPIFAEVSMALGAVAERCVVEGKDDD